MRAHPHGYRLDMEILVAILIIALIAAVAFAVMQRRPERRPAGARGLGRRRTSPLGRGDRGAARRDPMAAAVAEHAEATDPHDVVVAERRMRAQAHDVAAGLHTEAARSDHQRASEPVPHPGAAAGQPPTVEPARDPAYGDPRSDPYADPVTGPRPQGYRDPASDPRHDDPNYGDRPAADHVEPHDDRRR